MLEPKNLPLRLRGLVSDEHGDGVCLRRGHHRIVDGREFGWAPGGRVVHGRLLVLEHARASVEGELRIGTAEHARVTARAAEVTSHEGAFVRLLEGARGHLHGHTRFEVRSNAQAHLHDSSIGSAFDDAVIFIEPDWTGAVLVLGGCVRVVAPVGRRLMERETRRGLLYRLAP